MARKSTAKGMEIAPLNPGWIKRVVPDSYADNDLKRIVLFYVINTPCSALSSSSIPLTSYGWNKDLWKKNEPKKSLFDFAGLERDKTFFVAKKTNETKDMFTKASLNKKFHEKRDVEKVAIYKPSEYNEFMAILYHIRNAFAHGRLAMYAIDNSEDIVFALEDGIKRNGEFQVRSRMILKKSTLLKWIDILEKKENEQCQD